MEKTLVMIKPDGVQRGLIGEIISIFERVGLKLTHMKMLKPNRALIQKHYPDSDDWYSIVGHKTFQGYEASRERRKNRNLEPMIRL